MNRIHANGLVICVSGPSGVGKGTVIKALTRKNRELIHSISVTTRSPRPGERDGVSYYFRTPEQFERMLQDGDILEHDCYCGNYYGTPRAPLLEITGSGRDVIMDVTVPGSLAVMKNFPEAVTIFLMPPSFTELRHRLEKRGTESDSVLVRRLQKAREEIDKAQLFQYIVINDDVEKTADQILAIEQAERCRRERMTGIEKMILAR